ncbi:MAG: Rpn family recombination-promoting nuclease/putative transposase [Lachnospiraceae bacterium]|nr:Rpn family recombination-promoting nuclease/putative transposase [Lachnospiraceae bacterium]
MNRNQKQKPLHELTLLDRFLFAEVMDDPENMEILLEILLEKNVRLEFPTQTEKELRRSSLKRFARIDVWAEDENHAIYDTEVQRSNPSNLVKRSRYYQGMIDSNLLKPGDTDFNKLNPVYIIVIAPFDLFGYGLYRYTFHGQCDEIPELKLNDDATRIFLNTRGTRDDFVTPELIELLHYIEHTNESNAASGSVRLRRLQDNVRSIQENAEVGVKYMQLWEEFAMERAEARAEGRSVGLAEGRAEGLVEGRAEGLKLSLQSFLNELGTIPEDLQQKIESETETDTLQTWLKIAFKSKSVSDFTKQL